MQYVYQDREGDEFTRSQKMCEKEQEVNGYRLIGVIKGGKFEQTESKRRFKAVHDPERDDILNKFNEWGIA